MRTKLYIASCAPLADDARFDRLARTVPKARQEKLAQFKNAGSRRLSLGVSLLLTKALADEALFAEEIAVTERGKPYLPALPDFHFSLSHSGDMALCAVSPRAVGCDIEVPRRFDPALARRFFHPSECEWLFAKPETAQRDAFFQLWTCKESFMKALGLGFSLPMDAFAVIPEEPVSLTQHADARPWQIRSGREGACFFALCGLTGVADAPLIHVDFREAEP